jgi:hypothetical protein
MNTFDLGDDLLDDTGGLYTQIPEANVGILQLSEQNLGSLVKFCESLKTNG